MSSVRDPSRHPTYAFTDRSLARPTLTRLLFSPLFRLVPAWLAANLVTLLSFGSLLLVLGLALVPGLSPALLAVAFALCHLAYVSGDHLDGMQAVASGTTSPLGDFLDHYCDLWAGGILAYAWWILVGGGAHLVPRGALFLVQGCLILGFAVTYVEREERRALHFTALGALEANLLLTGFLLSWTSAAVRAWWVGSTLGVPRYWAFVAAGFTICAGVIAVILRRLGYVPWTLLLFTASLFVLGLLVTLHDELRPIEGWLLVGTLGGGYVGRVMRGYLLQSHRSRPDPLATAAILALGAWSWLGHPSASAFRLSAWALGLYLLGAMAWSLSSILGSLRRHWVWVNRTPESELQQA